LNRGGIKVLGLLNLSSHPHAKVGVVNSALFLVLIEDKHLESFEIEFYILAEKALQNILDCHKVITVAV
jgi:hypothetical protein